MSRFTDSPQAAERAVVGVKYISCTDCEGMGFKGADILVAKYDVLDNGSWRLVEQYKCGHCRAAEDEALAIMGRTREQGFPSLHDPLWAVYGRVMRERMGARGGLVRETVNRMLPGNGLATSESPAPAESLPAQTDAGNEPDTNAEANASPSAHLAAPGGEESPEFLEPGGDAGQE